VTKEGGREKKEGQREEKEEGEGEGGGGGGRKERDTPESNYSRSLRTSQYWRRQW
jgi:hypothetical protein